MLHRAALLLSLCSTVAVAQSSDTLAVAPSQDSLAVAAGARLRVVTKTRGTLPLGLLARQTPDSLVLLIDCRVCGMRDSSVAWREVRSVDRFAGRRHVRGALLGAAYGLAAGALVGTVAAKIGIHDCEQVPGNELCGIGVVLVPYGAIVGLTAGTVIGATFGVARWVRVWSR
jgi:hypothetical protein